MNIYSLHKNVLYHQVASVIGGVTMGRNDKYYRPKRQLPGRIVKRVRNLTLNASNMSHAQQSEKNERHVSKDEYHHLQFSHRLRSDALLECMYI